MDISGKRKISMVITVMLFFFFLFANIYTIRRLSHYAAELIFYDKLLVAYQVGGQDGLSNELDRILSQTNMPRQLALAKAFKAGPTNLEAADKFLQNIIAEKTNDINLFRNLRNIAFICIIALILLRLALNRFTKKF